MNATYAKSSRITVVGYDAAKREMLITFDDGDRCVLIDASSDDYKEMLQAERVGSHFFIAEIDTVGFIELCLVEVDKLKSISFNKPYGATGATGPQP